MAPPDAAVADTVSTDVEPTAVTLENGTRIAYAEYGRADGAPVVFFHGTPGSRHLGRLLAAAAREHGVRVIAFDRPGYGQSTRWPGRSITDAGRIVEAVLDDASVASAGLVAFSGGAPHALAGDAAGAVTEFRNTAAAWGVPDADVTAPVRFRHGGNDTNVPVDGVHRLADRLPAARVEVLDDADHLAALYRSVPDLVATHGRCRPHSASGVTDHGD